MLCYGQYTSGCCSVPAGTECSNFFAIADKAEPSKVTGWDVGNLWCNF